VCASGYRPGCRWTAIEVSAQPDPEESRSPLTHLNPATLHTNPAFSQGVRIDAPGALAVLAEAGGTQSDVAKLTVYLVAGSDARAL